MLVKFFPKDIISGKAEKAGDTFTAMFCGHVKEFTVSEIRGGMIFSEV
jgi:hypothetical protein